MHTAGCSNVWVIAILMLRVLAWKNAWAPSIDDVASIDGANGKTKATALMESFQDASLRIIVTSNHGS